MDTNIESDDKIIIRLILCGSGPRGAFQYGFINELLNDTRYKIDKIYATSMGSLNAIFTSNGYFDNFWERYDNIIPKLIYNYSYVGYTMTYFNSFFAGNMYDTTTWDNFLDEQLRIWQYSNNTIPITISTINKNSTNELHEFNENIKKHVPNHLIKKYLKDTITMTNIYENYDSTYKNINNGTNEYVPFTAMEDDLKNDNCHAENNNKIIYIMLPLESDTKILGCFPNIIDSEPLNFKNEKNYMTYIYRNIKHTQIQNCYDFFNNTLFIYHCNETSVNIKSHIEWGKFEFRNFTKTIHKIKSQKIY